MSEAEQPSLIPVIAAWVPAMGVLGTAVGTLLQITGSVGSVAPTALRAAGIGLVLGAVIPLLFAPIIAASLPIPVMFTLYPGPLAEAAGYGVLTALLFARALPFATPPPPHQRAPPQPARTLTP